MGRWAYYSPIALGILLVLSVHSSVRVQVAWLPDWLELPTVGAIALGAGLFCQLVLVGVQGAFAQVLPVPGGRSVRGSGAVLAGALLLLSLALGFAAGLLGLEGVGPVAVALAILSGAAVLGALATYAWNLPAAVHDFGDRD